MDRQTEGWINKNRDRHIDRQTHGKTNRYGDSNTRIDRMVRQSDI